MVAIFVLAASALLAVPAVVAAPETSPNHLFARQLAGFDPSSIPTSCLTQCQSVESTFATGNCTTEECVCTADFINAIKVCEQCAMGIDGFTQADVDGVIKEWAQTCSAAGFPISGLTTSGGSSSLAASGPSAAPGTQAASSAALAATTAASSAAHGTGAASGAASTATSAASSGSSGSSSSTAESSTSGASMLTAGVFGSFAAIALGALNL